MFDIIIYHGFIQRPNEFERACVCVRVCVNVRVCVWVGACATCSTELIAFAKVCVCVCVCVHVSL